MQLVRIATNHTKNKNAVAVSATAFLLYRFYYNCFSGLPRELTSFIGNENPNENPISGNQRTNNAADETSNRCSLALIGRFRLLDAEHTKHNAGNRKEKSKRSGARNARNHKTNDTEN